MRFHWGVPHNPMELKARTNRTVKDGKRQNRYIEHKLERWYGVSFGTRSFIGVMLFGETTRSVGTEVD